MNRLQAFKLVALMNDQTHNRGVLYVAIPHKRHGWFGWYYVGWTVEEWRWQGKKWETIRELPIALESPRESRTEAVYYKGCRIRIPD